METLGIVPVVVIQEAKDALPLAKALTEGGLPCAEITFRTEAAEGAIQAIAAEYPDMFIGAGTILTVEQAQRAVSAGAKFIVSPGFDSEVVDYCIQREIPVIPGCCTPSEVMQAVKKGLKTIKFFPAEQAGGLPMMKAMGAAFGELKFMPTGGISMENLQEYLSWDRVIACGGSWMVKGDLETVKKLTMEAVEMVKQIRGELQ